MKVSLIVLQMWKHLTEVNILLRRWLMLKFVEMDSPGRLLCIGRDEKLARFGTSLGVGDINKDGLLDLVVGEPYAGYQDLQYGGGVAVLLGNLGEGGP